MGAWAARQPEEEGTGPQPPAKKHKGLRQAPGPMLSITDPSGRGDQPLSLRQHVAVKKATVKKRDGQIWKCYSFLHLCKLYILNMSCSSKPTKKENKERAFAKSKTHKVNDMTTLFLS